MHNKIDSLVKFDSTQMSGILVDVEDGPDKFGDDARLLISPSN